LLILNVSVLFNIFDFIGTIWNNVLLLLIIINDDDFIMLLTYNGNIYSFEFVPL
jgi:hypothetical protein